MYLQQNSEYSTWLGKFHLPGTSVYLSRNFKTFKEPRNRFHGIISSSLCSLRAVTITPIPTWFLASIDCLKISALFSAGTLPFSFSSRKYGNLLVSSQEARKTTFYFRCEKPGNPTISTARWQEENPPIFFPNLLAKIRGCKKRKCET